MGLYCKSYHTQCTKQPISNELDIPTHEITVPFKFSNQRARQRITSKLPLRIHSISNNCPNVFLTQLLPQQSKKKETKPQCRPSSREIISLRISVQALTKIWHRSSQRKFSLMLAAALMRSANVSNYQSTWSPPPLSWPCKEWSEFLETNLFFSSQSFI